MIGQEFAVNPTVAESETPSQTQPAAEENGFPLTVSVGATFLTRTPPQSVAVTPSSAGPLLNSFKDMTISSESTHGHFEASAPLASAIPVSRSSAVVGDETATSFNKYIEESCESDCEPMTPVMSITTVVETHGVKNTFYETIC